MQGRSRRSIIKELQKTNLDVNLTINNLLARELSEEEKEVEEEPATKSPHKHNVVKKMCDDPGPSSLPGTLSLLFLIL